MFLLLTEKMIIYFNLFSMRRWFSTDSKRNFQESASGVWELASNSLSCHFLPFIPQSSPFTTRSSPFTPPLPFSPPWKGGNDCRYDFLYRYSHFQVRRAESQRGERVLVVIAVVVFVVIAIILSSFFYLVVFFYILPIYKVNYSHSYSYHSLKQLMTSEYASVFLIFIYSYVIYCSTRRLGLR